MGKKKKKKKNKTNYNNRELQPLWGLACNYRISVPLFCYSDSGGRLWSLVACNTFHSRQLLAESACLEIPISCALYVPIFPNVSCSSEQYTYRISTSCHECLDDQFAFAKNNYNRVNVEQPFLSALWVKTRILIGWSMATSCSNMVTFISIVFLQKKAHDFKWLHLPSPHILGDCTVHQRISIAFNAWFLRFKRLIT